MAFLETKYLILLQCFCNLMTTTISIGIFNPKQVKTLPTTANNFKAIHLGLTIYLNK